MVFLAYLLRNGRGIAGLMNNASGVWLQHKYERYEGNRELERHRGSIIKGLEIAKNNYFIFEVWNYVV